MFFLSNIDHDKKLNLSQTFLLTALSWITIAIFGSLPFIFSDLEMSLTNFFESMSGITTTGSTVIVNLKVVPKSILILASNITMVRWYRNYINGNHFIMPIMNVGGMQILKYPTLMQRKIFTQI